MADRADNRIYENGKLLVTLPKNSVSEFQVRTKTVRERASGETKHFIEVREWWFKDGPMSEPLATRKGVMVHRENIAALVAAFLGELHPGEVPDDVLADIKMHADRLSIGA